MTLLIDIGRHSCECTDHALNELYKAAADPPGGDGLWRPHEHPLISAHIESVTERVGVILEQIHGAFALRLSGAPVRRGLAKALSWARWSEHQFRDAEKRLAGKDPSAYTIEDWMTMVDWVVQKYLPDAVINTEAEYLAVRSAIMGKVQANMDRMKLDPAAMAAIGAALPTVEAGYRGVLAVSALHQHVIDFAKARAAELVTDIGERTRHRLKSMILDQHIAGHPDLRKLEQQMFDEFAILNRDWRRVALTECARNENEGFIASMPYGAKVRRIEVYQGACAFCRKIHGEVFTVVDAANEEKDGDTEVWIGKTNVGRSASPRKRVGDELVERTPGEMWWVAAGTQHPNCRGYWQEVMERPDAVDPAFHDWAKDLLATA